jgi:hypothetical protein
MLIVVFISTRFLKLLNPTQTLSSALDPRENQYILRVGTLLT